MDHPAPPGQSKSHRLTPGEILSCSYAINILKIKLRLSFDNRSVAKAVIHFPLRKLFTFYSIFSNLLSPENFGQALDATCQMPAIGAERNIQQLCSRFLGRRGMQVSAFKGAE